MFYPVLTADEIVPCVKQYNISSLFPANVGYADILYTMMCSSEGPVIKSAVLPRLNFVNWPDLASLMFSKTLQALITIFNHEEVFDKTRVQDKVI